jgi:hypothetical protein
MPSMGEPFSKLNVSGIVKEHFDTLYDYRTGRRSVGEIVVFVGLPVALGAAGVWKAFRFDTNVLNGMLAAFAIFAGLLLNLLMLAWGFVVDPRFSGADAGAQLRRRFLREIHQNLSFAILVSIAVVVLSLAGLFFTKDPRSEGTPWPLTFLLHVLLANFVLTLLMVLKRIHSLLSEEFKRPSVRKSA